MAIQERVKGSGKALIALAVLTTALFVFFSIVFLSSARAISYETDSVTYEYKNGVMSVTGCSDDVENIHIVSHIQQYPVTNINASAFAVNNKIKTVTIDGNTLKTIGEGAFYGCSNLEWINIPTSVESIASYTFGDCTSLQKIELPASVGIIPDGCFEYCTSLTQASCYAYGLGYHAFSHCESLSSLTINAAPEDMDDDDDDSYYEDGDNKFTKYSYEGEGDDDDDAAASIVSSYAIAHCKSLHYVALPNGFTTVNDGAFACSGDMTVFMPDSVTNISSSAFRNVSNVTIRCHEGSAADLMAKDFGYRIEYVRSLANARITGVKDGVYKGSDVKQSVSVQLAGVSLVAGRDYYMTYDRNNKIGLAMVTVKACGEMYEGERSFGYKIKPATPSIKKLKATKKGFTATWSQAAKSGGYKLKYSTKSNMKGAKTVTVKKAANVSKKISKLKSGKKYYVQVRAYKDVEFGDEDEELAEQYNYADEVRFWSTWSKVKSVKVK